MPLDLPTTSRNRQYRLQLGSRLATYCSANMQKLHFITATGSGQRDMIYDKTDTSPHIIPLSLSCVLQTHELCPVCGLTKMHTDTNMKNTCAHTHVAHLVIQHKHQIRTKLFHSCITHTLLQSKRGLGVIVLYLLEVCLAAHWAPLPVALQTQTSKSSGPRLNTYTPLFQNDTC